MFGHVWSFLKGKMTMFNVLNWRAIVALWSFWSFYNYTFKKYICMYTKMYRPITTPTCCESMTKMTITPQTLLFSTFYYGHYHDPRLTMA